MRQTHPHVPSRICPCIHPSCNTSMHATPRCRVLSPFKPTTCTNIHAHSMHPPSPHHACAHPTHPTMPIPLLSHAHACASMHAHAASASCPMHNALSSLPMRRAWSPLGPPWCQRASASSRTSQRCMRPLIRLSPSPLRWRRRWHPLCHGGGVTGSWR